MHNLPQWYYLKPLMT